MLTEPDAGDCAVPAWKGGGAVSPVVRSVRSGVGQNRSRPRAVLDQDDIRHPGRGLSRKPIRVADGVAAAAQGSLASRRSQASSALQMRATPANRRDGEASGDDGGQSTASAPHATTPCGAGQRGRSGGGDARMRPGMRDSCELS